MRVNHSRPHIAMSQHHLDGSYIVIGLQEMGRETVTEGMRSNALCELSPPDRFVKRFLDMSFMQMIPPPFLRILQDGQ